MQKRRQESLYRCVKENRRYVKLLLQQRTTDVASNRTDSRRGHSLRAAHLNWQTLLMFLATEAIFND